MQGLTAIVALVVLAVLAPAARAAGTPPVAYSEVLVAGGFSGPTGIAFLPNKDILVTQKTGELRKIAAGTGTVTTVTTFPTTCSGSEMGLLGIAIDPAFTTSGNGFVYLYRTDPGTGSCAAPTGRVNQVERITLSGGAFVAGSHTVLLTGIQTDGGNHNAGTVRLGPDNKLYVSVGDTGIGDGGPPGASTNPYAQALNSLNGKVLRLELTGAPAAGNPFIGTPGARPEIWALGFRNPYRMSFDQFSGKLWAGDVGQETLEEIDVVQAGGNYSWPYCEGDQPSGCKPLADVAPAYVYPRSGPGVIGRSVTGGAVSGATYGNLPRTYIFGDFISNKLWSVQLTPARDDFNGDPIDFVTNASGPVDVVTGPEGDIYYVSWNSGEVRRVTPNYPRPQAATPLHAALVPAQQVCASPNRVHAAPLSYGSCTPPNQTSGSLTVGTPDANGAAANSTGSVHLTVCNAPACTGPDVRIKASLTDVRCKAGVSTCTGTNTTGGNDYTGQVQVRIPHRITDKNNNAPSGGSTAATTVETAFNVTVPCATTADTSIGGACDINTTANTLVPGAVTGAMRAIWELNQLQVFDGGSDGVVSTNPNTLFAVQGIFIP